MATPKYHKGGSKKWILDEDYTYHSPRYDKDVVLKKGYESDGATGAIDIDETASWWVHDKLCEDMAWADGTPCSRWKGSVVLADILHDEGHHGRERSWKYATMLPKIVEDVKNWFKF